jgi:hypothetical protein
VLDMVTRSLLFEFHLRRAKTFPAWRGTPPSSTRQDDAGGRNVPERNHNTARIAPGGL